mmetsp:Transcript_36178/g.79546  ORF Transcript_36178/g.79546 Transcript_36178/m.79546 type:complete len:114 (+) Transcript_36178:227-568(+)
MASRPIAACSARADMAAGPPASHALSSFGCNPALQADPGEQCIQPLPSCCRSRIRGCCELPTEPQEPGICMQVPLGGTAPGIPGRRQKARIWPCAPGTAIGPPPGGAPLGCAM